MTQQQLSDLGVPWYCDDCGKRVTWITTYTDEDLELERQRAAQQAFDEYDMKYLERELKRQDIMKDRMKDKSDDEWIKKCAESSAKFTD